MANVTWLVLNAASGSNDEAAVAEVKQALAGAGCAPQRVVHVPDEPLPDRAALEAAVVELLVLFAGDGTASRVVAGLDGWAGAVLVLPGGTQNLLARALHGEATAAEIVARLGRGELRPVRRPLLRCSAGEALVEIVAGPGATWSDVRESLREGDVGELAAALGKAIEQSAGGPMVAIVEPPLGLPDGYPAVRLQPDGGSHGRLTVDGYGAQSLLEYAQHGLALLQRDFRQGPHDRLGTHPAVVCRSPAPIELMLDGERATAGLEERFEVGEGTVTFLASGGEHG